MNYFIDYMRSYLSLLFPVELEPGESIRLFFLKKTDAGQSTLVKFVTDFDEVYKLILKYRNSYNCFISLATYKDNAPYKRHVLFLDYDQKDFPDFTDARNYTAYFKSKIPNLYNHMIVLSGSGGCHFYIGCEPAENSKACELNKRLCKIANADPRACTTTQVARIPGSYNLKHEGKSVTILNADRNYEDINRYSLSQLDTIFKRCENTDTQKSVFTVPEQTDAVDISNFHCSCYCVNNMLANGAVKGDRNFCLGRITANLKKDLYTYEVSKELVLAWNSRCIPPKTIHETVNDFNTYWFEDKYKLLGCKISDDRKESILRKYCKPDLCQQAKHYTDNSVSKNLMYISSLFCSKKMFHELTSYQYTILLSLGRKSEQCHNYENMKKCFSDKFSEKTINKAFKDLFDKNLISISNGQLELKKINSKFYRDISINQYVLKSFLENKQPTAAEFKVYLALRYLLQSKMPATLDSISSHIGLGKSTVSEHIKALETKGIIQITKKTTERGLLYNYYTFTDFKKSIPKS